MSAAPDAIVIRRFQPSDAEETATIFFRAVREGTVGHYSDAQRHAWAKSIPETESWRTRLESQTSFVAEISGVISGFMTVNGDGYIDLAFVAPEHIHHGIGKRLYLVIEIWALDNSVKHLTTEASLVAKPFFLKRGWTVVQKQTIVRHGVELTNFRMEKDL